MSPFEILGQRNRRVIRSGPNGFPVFVVNTYPVSVHRVPACWRSRCSRSAATGRLVQRDHPPPGVALWRPGLRLEHGRPGGRLLAARDIGAATVRIPLTRPDDLDAEALGWLQRAYAENAAPPGARHRNSGRSPW